MKKVLVLEDEASIRSFIVINLQRAGYEVVEAKCGEEALQKLQENPDTKLCLLDIMLPDIDGFEVCRRIRMSNAQVAIEQLTEWSNRAGVDIIAQQEGSDPAAVIYDAIAAAKSRNADVLICDTAGRLHNKKNLMEELKKINRIIDKEYPDAYRETLVVLDGTTGQNALAQAKQFMEVADITGIILTKLDGTAKGGIAVAIQSELGIPVKYVGIGEKIDDLQKFDANDFVNALFKRNEALTENE